VATHTKALIFAVGLGALGVFGLTVNHHLKWSDATLTRQFLAHRADFERIVRMANADTHLTRIAPDFTYLDNNASWPREDVGISDQRWDEYKRLFRVVGAPVGIIHDPATQRVIIPLVDEGLVPTGDEKGVVYSPTALSPVLKSLDETPPAKFWNGPDRSDVLVYKPIQGHWYLYYEAW
jgi:hypothetical protein